MPVGRFESGLPPAEHPWPDVRRHRFGRLTVDVAGQGFRNLAVDGQVVVREIYPAVRAPDWSTLAVTTTGTSVQQHPDRWEVTVRQELSGRLKCVTLLRVMSEKDIVIQHQLKALREEVVNRWGLNLCLDARAWSGAAVQIAGRKEVLPVDIGPQHLVAGQLQALFPSSGVLTLQHPSAGQLALASSGPELEVEDQRNWTDPTYKVYSGPLAAPRPIVLAAGSTSQQELTVSWEAGNEPLGSAAAPVGHLSAPQELLRVGVQLNEAAAVSPGELTTVLTELAVDHVRLDAERTEGAVLRALASVEVELAVLASDGQREHDKDAAAALVDQTPAVSRVLWHFDQRRTTTAADAATVSDALGSNAASVVVVPGTDAYFADLNRDRPHVADSVSFSVSPTVHTRDSETVFASLPSQAETVARARALADARVLVSPVTFGIRGAPETSHDKAHRAAGAQPDQRLAVLEGAAWTVGSVHAMLHGRAWSATYHELFGEGGLIVGSGVDRLIRPAFHAIAALQANRRPRVGTVNLPGASWVALHLVDRHEVLVASLRPWSQSADLSVLHAAVQRRRRLRERDVPVASRTLRWWPTAAAQEQSTGERLDLEGFEICLCDLGRRA